MTITATPPKGKIGYCTNFLRLWAVAVIAAVAWARMVTGNHTRVQIALGILVSVASVLIAYGLMSLWRPL